MNKKFSKLKSLSLYVLTSFVLLFTLVLYSCKPTNTLPTFGVWWWNKNLEIDKYLSFAKDNNITEIYYCDSNFNDNTKEFIKNAKERNIRVFFLSGEYTWLSNSAPLYKLIDRFVSYQNENPNLKFEGIHLDIEPHQDPNFKENRTSLLEKLISIVYDLSNKYSDIKFDYDIPFWIHDEITFNGKTQPAYAHIIENANRTFLMSYRDTAEAIFKVSKEEIEFAQSVNKTLVLGVETKSNEGDNVSFMEEGKFYMNEQIEKLRKMIPDNFGISVHQIKTWYDLKD